MKKNFWNFVTVFSLILLCVCLIQIANLKQEVQNMKNNLSHQISNMENSLMHNTSYVEEILKQEASILAKSEWSYGDYNIENQTVDVKASVTPKEYTPEKTTASIMIDGQEVPMEFSNGEYVVNFPVSLFEEMLVGQVMFYETETVRAENLEWTIMPLYEYLPVVNAYLVGGERSGIQNGEYIWKHSGTLEVYVEKKGEDSSVESVTMIRCLDGQEVDSMEIPVEENAQYMSDYYHEIDLSYKIPFGSVQDIYVDVVDGNGLCYRVTVDHIALDEEGTYIEDDQHWSNNDVIVYDQQGTELYRGIW